jgi:hypothetical protein
MAQCSLCILVILIAITIVLIIKYSFPKQIENYNIVYGTAAKQIYSYDRCVNDCFRDFTGINYPENYYGNVQILV